MNLEQFIECLNWRSAIKSFNASKKVSEQDVENLLEVLRLSPSSLGVQPWKFMLVQDEKVRLDLRKAAHDQSQVTDSSCIFVLCSFTDISMNDVDRHVLNMSNLRGVELSSLDKYRDNLKNFVESRTKEELAIWSKKQVYIALGNLLTACAVVGIDTCPMEGFDAAEFDRILGLKEQGLSATVACAIGYRSENDRISKLKKVRFNKDEVVLKK